MGFNWRKLVGAIGAVGAYLCAASAQESLKLAGVDPVPGYFNPKTGVFTPGPRMPSGAIGAATTTAPVVLTGKITIKINATIKSAIPNSATFNASGSISNEDDTYTNSAGNSFTLTRDGNDTASGQLVLPYTWGVLSASEKMTIQISVVVNSTSGPRPLIQNMQIIALPADKADTTVVFPITL